MEQPEQKVVGRYRTPAGFSRWLLIALSIGGIATAVFYSFNLSILGVTFCGLGYFYLLYAIYLPMAFILFPSTEKASRRKVPWYDFIAILAGFSLPFFLFLHAYPINYEGWEVFAPWHVQIISLFFLLTVFELGRRIGGKVLSIICLFFAAYPLFASHLPGALEGLSFPFWRVVNFHAMSDGSVLGLPMIVVGRLVIGFMTFAVALQVTGGGEFFLNLALSLLGHTRGGAAKVSVMASAFFGSISGSVVANVLTTGAVTIPTMKRTGYPDYYAGAIEACASTGGVLMPPIMGATAFLLAQFLEIPYLTVVIAAIIPSILYYLGLFFK